MALRNLENELIIMKLDTCDILRLLICESETKIVVLGLEKNIVFTIFTCWIFRSDLKSATLKPCKYWILFELR